MVLRIGELLVAQGVLTEEQVERVLEIQREVAEPFGLICERVFGISPEVIEGAWTEQYSRLTEGWRLEDHEFDPAVSSIVTPRQAWQFRVLPVRFDEGSLVLATTRSSLARALRFATKVIKYPAVFVLVDADRLAAELVRRHPLAGLDARSLASDRLQDHLPVSVPAPRRSRRA